jgi:hypothetical protein
MAMNRAGIGGSSEVGFPTTLLDRGLKVKKLNASVFDEPAE